MKKIVLVAAALLSVSLCFAQKSVDLKGTVSKAGSVDSTWEWKGTPKKSPIGEDATTVTKVKEIPAGIGSVKGAKFEIVKGEAKFKTEDGITAIYHNNKGSATIETIEKNKKCEYAVTLEDTATIELTVTGNGFGEASRCVVVKRGEEEVLLSIDHLNKENPDEVLTLANAPAGTYRVLVNGSRIVKVTAKN
ncbi:hypothetical protein [Treponema sp.]|uniref:hypothetical protein n=1 Tax=Treponema sp. TaxID=166 RepID=UPI00388FB8E2